jgi:hypothetical protein
LTTTKVHRSQAAGGAKEEHGGGTSIAALIHDRDNGLPKSGVAAHLTPTRSMCKLQGEQQKCQKKAGTLFCVQKAFPPWSVWSAANEEPSFHLQHQQKFGVFMCFLKDLEACHWI